MGGTVISGTGLFSALGVGCGETLAALAEGESALFPWDGAPADEWTPLAGEVPEIDEQRWLGGPAGLLDRTSLLMLAAASQAFENAGVDPKSFPCGRIGVAAGTVWGGIASASAFFRDAVEKGPRLVKPMLFPHTYGNTGASLVAMRHGLSGPHSCDMTGRVAGAQAFVEALNALREDRADAMLVVAGESLSAQRRAAVAAQGVLPRGTAEDVPRPFGRHGAKTGCVLGEAGIALLLEPGAGAKQDVAKVHAAALAPNAEAAVRAALRDAARTPGDISLVVTSACGVPASDRLEAIGLREIFADGTCPPVTAPLALCGELDGADAPLLVAVAALCHRHKTVPPVVNLFDAEVGGLHYARPGDVPAPGNAALVVTVDAASRTAFACVVE